MHHRTLTAIAVNFSFFENTVERQAENNPFARREQRCKTFSATFFSTLLPVFFALFLYDAAKMPQKMRFSPSRSLHPEVTKQLAVAGKIYNSTLTWHLPVENDVSLFDHTKVFLVGHSKFGFGSFFSS